jgi:hypothetical protein
VTTLSRTLRAATLLAVLLLAVATPVSAAPAAAFKVLVFSKTTAFRHDSIPAGIAAIRQLGQQNDFAVDATEDDAVFTDTGLAPYAAVVLENTSTLKPAAVAADAGVATARSNTASTVAARRVRDSVVTGTPLQECKERAGVRAVKPSGHRTGQVKISLSGGTVNAR